MSVAEDQTPISITNLSVLAVKVISVLDLLWHCFAFFDLKLHIIKHVSYVGEASRPLMTGMDYYIPDK